MKRLLIAFSLLVAFESSAKPADLELTLRYQEPTSQSSTNFHRLHRSENWQPKQTAVIVCDMWDSHHCVNAVRRVAQLAPRINEFCEILRGQGVAIIHAPSSCVDSYRDHPARSRVEEIPMSKSLPEDIASWCNQIPAEEMAAYPLDQSAGGEDDDPADHAQWATRLEADGRNPRSPWKSQVASIRIDGERDFISDNGEEVWSILAAKGIENVILVGVHTNMCVLGRPFGLRRLAAAGKNVVLCRDLTDTMYDPNAWPYANHFTGTDLIISHIERYVCPTIASEQVLGGDEFRFRMDQRPRLAILIAEDEYETDRTLPAFAAKHLTQEFQVATYFGNSEERHDIVGFAEIAQADALLVSVRRRALDERHIAILQAFVAQGKPVMGIRTASHAFSLRGKEPPAGKTVWEDFDPRVFGGHYSNHHGNKLKTTVHLPESSAVHGIVGALKGKTILTSGSLYRVAPLEPGTNVLLTGSVEGAPSEPVAWTFIRSDGGRSFYTSLGHPADFEHAEFETLLRNGIHWACGLPLTDVAAVEQQNERFRAGKGSQ